ncbi:MAG TPA: GNAT family N-acyltransferase [Aquabacterium sp.]|uniref:GNAT family N-acetyltransferase n=1 Tax=Aquabacterium sp. TaxID=1872578 RepID=UPI002E2EBB63|nr:GNAT family N-acyltransferase [Aquabacterium sp.]HEX5373629.1 GNAT family N-acyltransferase [Aquabacterium sp.]
MRDLPLPTLPLSDLTPSLSRSPALSRRSLHGRSLGSGLEQAPQKLEVVWARTAQDVLAAQRLRHLVFVDEMGARLTVPAGSPEGHDIDLFDPYCEHLLVRLVEEDGEPGEVIGTYRVLTPEASRRIGGLYSETEFDLTRLRPLRGKMVELGRSCVHPDHRQGGVIMALWGALAEFMVRNDLDTMIGCASISMRDGGHVAASLWEQLRHTHLAPIDVQVRPRLPLPVDDLDRSLAVEPPALIKGYLRCGARILGAPAWDPDFNTADLPMMMRLADLPSRYRRHFLGA